MQGHARPQFAADQTKAGHRCIIGSRTYIVAVLLVAGQKKKVFNSCLGRDLYLLDGKGLIV